MNVKDALARLTLDVRRANAWYRNNRDVAAPALFAFRDIITGIIQARGEEDQVNRLSPLGDPSVQVPQLQVYEDLAGHLTRLGDSLVPLLARIHEMRKVAGNASQGGPVSDGP